MFAHYILHKNLGAHFLPAKSQNYSISIAAGNQ